jgi:hypothetical protein
LQVNMTYVPVGTVSGARAVIRIYDSVEPKPKETFTNCKFFFT